MSEAPLRILFLSAELAPIAQSGGLGDAVSGLALALARRGHEVVCALPAYRQALASPDCPELSAGAEVRLDGAPTELRGRWREGRLVQGQGAELDLRLFDLPELYDRGGLYGDEDGPFEDEALRFAAFARAAALLAAQLGPDVLVAHDWHCALALCLLRELHGAAGRDIATVQVVHNGAYQGRFASSAMEFTGLPPALFSPEGLEFFGDLCLLKAGLQYSDRIVTVSPTYARELTTPEFGNGLEGLFAHRGAELVGIANGIDSERFDPATDAALAANYSSADPSGKDRCRAALLEEFGLAAPEAGLLLGAVGRFASQKGWDVLADSVAALVAGGACLVLLGDGEASIAAQLVELAQRYPERVAVFAGWDEALARRVYAGVDCTLIPSRFEPCGLVQLLSQRYGALPIAHAVGGLVDTIADGRTGVLHGTLTPAAMAEAVARARELFEREGAAALRRRLLDLDVSWNGPAQRWEQLLTDAVGGRA